MSAALAEKGGRSHPTPSAADSVHFRSGASRISILGTESSTTLTKEAAPLGIAKPVRIAIGVVLAAFALLVIVAPAFMGPGERLPLTQTPTDFGLGFESVAFEPPDLPITIRAWWIPAARSKAAVVMVHGGGLDNRSLPYANGLALAADLVAHGYSVLAIDLRNYGESDATPDHRITFGDSEANDVIGAMNYLGARHPGCRFGALGMSMGGETALYAAARDRRLEAVVTDGTFAESGPIAANFARAATGIPKFLLPPFLWSAEHLHAMHLSRGRALDVVGAIAPRPVLLIHNEADPIVPAEDARRLAAAIYSSELWITAAPVSVGDLGPFGTHVQCYKLNPEEYVKRVTDFFDRVFGKRRA